MKHINTIYSLAAFASLTMSTLLFAQDKGRVPSMEVYEDVGRGVGMEWKYQALNGKPLLEFGVTETNHRLDRLWEFSCASLENGRSKIANTVFAKPPEVREGDRFGFSIRIDDGKSFGLIGRNDLFEIQGFYSHFPQFDIFDSHSLWGALRRGERAFVNMNGNKFSIHLEGSADPIKRFLNACRKSNN